jgi:integrase
MSSTWKHPQSKYWYACFTDKDGKKCKRSTKTTNHTLAKRLAHKFEEAAGKKLTKRAARQIIGDIYEHVSGEQLPGETVQAFFDRWVKQTKTRVADGTWRKYHDEAKRFVASLGEKAKLDISTVNRTDVIAFQTGVADRLSIGTANTALKILRVALNEAHKQGLLEANPAADVLVLSTKDIEGVRRPFTIPEVKKLLKLANQEWRGMILFGFYTGQRLQDIATANWSGIDLKTQTWTFIAKKTGQRKALPLAQPIQKYLHGIKASRSPESSIFPTLAASVRKTKRAAQASNEFHDLLVKASLLAARSKQGTGKGRDGKRQQNELSFHSLRHTNNSLLKKAGVPESVVMALVGHDSPEISKQYTHVENESLIKAVKKLPNILK